MIERATHELPAVLPGFGARSIGAFAKCRVCVMLAPLAPPMFVSLRARDEDGHALRVQVPPPTGSWLRYGATPLCPEHARANRRAARLRSRRPRGRSARRGQKQERTSRRPARGLAVGGVAMNAACLRIPNTPTRLLEVCARFRQLASIADARGYPWPASLDAWAEVIATWRAEERAHPAEPDEAAS